MQKNSEILIGFRNTLWGDAIQCFCNQHEGSNVTGIYPLENVVGHLHSKSKLHRVVILEVDCPSNVLVSIISSLRKLDSAVSIIVVSSECTEMSVSNLMSYTIDGLIFKEYCSKSDFLSCLNQVLSKKTFLCSAATNKLLNEYRQTERPNQYLLTIKEKEVLFCMVRGDRNKLIADQLKVSESTIKTHRKSIMRKLKADNLLGVIARAFEQGLLSSNEVPFCNYCEKRNVLFRKLPSCAN